MRNKKGLKLSLSISLPVFLLVSTILITIILDTVTDSVLAQSTQASVGDNTTTTQAPVGSSNTSSNQSSTKSGKGKKKGNGDQDDDDKMEDLSFNDYDGWVEDYPDCNTDRNPYASPIDISTADVIRVKDTQTLLVHADVPRWNTYVFSTLFKSDNNVQVEAYSIRLKSEDNVRDASYISGLGTNDHRFFDSALFFFQQGEEDEPLPPSRTGHTIDGKRFPMEVVFNFQTNLGQHKTQIHVLVEVVDEPSNPVWMPIIELLDHDTTGSGPILYRNVINETCSGGELKRNMTRALDIAYHEYKDMVTEQTKHMKGTTYEEHFEELLQLYQIVAPASSTRIRELQMNFRNTRKKLTACMKDAESEEHEMKEIAQKLVRGKFKLARLMFKLRGLKSPRNTTGGGNGTTAAQVNSEVEAQQKEIDELRVANEQLLVDQQTLRGTIQQHKECVSLEEPIAAKLEKEIADLKKLLEDNKIGPKAGDLFPTVEELELRLNETGENAELLSRLKNIYFDTQDDYEELMANQQRSSTIQKPFHISWLFPARGGHYFYNGSSPIPPCRKRDHVIVFEDTITISEAQFQAFRSFPAKSQHPKNTWDNLCDKGKVSSIQEYVAAMDKIRNQMPEIAPRGSRIVFFNPRNLQYKGDDGVHMLSRIRRTEKWKFLTTPRPEEERR